MGKGEKVEKLKGTAKTKGFLVAGLLFALACPVLADHGPLTTTVRDSWVDARLQDLVSAGLVSQPEKPLSELTNLEVAQLTKQATENWYAQVPSAQAGTEVPGGKSLKELVEEFKNELGAMDVDVFKLEDRIYDQQHRTEKFAALQDAALLHTGTNVSGSSRGYFDTYRGLGPNAIYGPLDYNDIMMGDIELKSVPVPSVLFDADVRMTRTLGLYYADPVTPNFSLRWISLMTTNDICNLTAGDFWRHYTPLTLWNPEIPVYTMVEPTSYNRARKDIEDWVYMNHGPDWRLRGFEAASDQKLEKDAFLSSFHLQAMGGELTSASAFTFANEYAGGEAALDFFNDNLEIKGTGLLLFDDQGSSNAPYLSTLISTFAHTYQIGSLSATGMAPFDKDIDAKGSVEYAGSWYQDDSRNPQSVLQDWALLATGGIDAYGVHLSAKYLTNGAYFYSPGAQTNRFNPMTQGPFSLLDDGLGGYPVSFVFSGVGRPSFAPYDRLAENMLPYGDATPNREGLILFFSADIGKDGWLKPQASYTVDVHEIQPDYVLTTSGNSELPVDFNTPITNTRKFGGFETALTADFAKAADGLPSTCDLAVDFKHQTTDLGMGGSPFTVDTLIVAADAGPFPGVPLFDGLVLSGAYERAQSSGNEYTLNGAGSPPTLAVFATYFDYGYLGSFASTPLNIIRDSWAAGVKCPVSSTINVHGDCFINAYTWSDVPSFDRREIIWRMTYELTF